MIGAVGHGGATYKACEFVGPLIQELSIDGRIVLSNMAVEMGAKNGIINPDIKTIEYVKNRTDVPFNQIEMIYFEYNTALIQLKSETSVSSRLGFRILKKFKPESILIA